MVIYNCSNEVSSVKKYTSTTVFRSFRLNYGAKCSVSLHSDSKNFLCHLIFLNTCSLKSLYSLSFCDRLPCKVIADFELVFIGNKAQRRPAGQCGGGESDDAATSEKADGRTPGEE